MANLTAKVMKFKIWTGEGGRFLKVFVWQSRSQMREYAIDREPRWNGDKFDGCYLGANYVYKNTGSGPLKLKSRGLGEIHFWRGRVDPEVVSHEIMHHMTKWIEHLRFVLEVAEIGSEPHNEDLSYQCGRLNRQFWQEYNAKNKKLLGRALA